MARRLRSMLVVILLSLAVPIASCEATPGRALTAPASPPEVAVAAVSWEPPARGDRIARVVRARIELGSALPADGVREGRVVVVRGGADAADLADLARGRTSGRLAGRLVDAIAWGEPAGAPTVVRVQPLAPLGEGAIAIVILRDRKPPLVVDATVEDDGTPIATRVYPPPGRTSSPDASWIYCLGPAADATVLAGGADVSVTLAPAPASARAAAVPGAPCVALAPASTLVGTFAPPPFLDGFAALDPAPVRLTTDAPRDVEAACADDEIALGLACARVDDDRVIFAAADAPSWIVGVVGGERVLAPLSPRDRVVVRGLAADAPLVLALDVHGQETRRFELSARTLPAHHHLVVNEALARPPSGAPSQRFVELVNDGAEPIDLDGLVVQDGDVDIALPPATLPPGAFALLLPDAYVDGLAGEAPPSPDALRLYVDALKLTGGIAVVDADGTVRSRLPATTSTKTASRGRRAPDRPDDAPDAFGWDARGRATPGRANEIGP